MEPIFLSPYLQEKIWGGHKLQDIFHFDLPSDHVGEAWVISAHPNGHSTVSSPVVYAGLTLDALYTKAPELFGHPSETTFPLLIKILDAKEDLSVQVHPDDAYAIVHEGERGKSECWYVIDADPGTEIIYGHHAQSREDFLDKVNQADWDGLLHRTPIKPGDFFDVPAGTIHAIGGGALILETQQSSDTTYRVYDYDRTDADGNQRELHIEKSADVTIYPANFDQPERVITQDEGGKLTRYTSNPYFTVYGLDVNGTTELDFTALPYILGTVIKGQGELTIDDQIYTLPLGQAFILPADTKQATFSGDCTIIYSYPTNP